MSCTLKGTLYPGISWGGYNRWYGMWHHPLSFPPPSWSKWGTAGAGKVASGVPPNSSPPSPKLLLGLDAHWPMGTKSTPATFSPPPRFCWDQVPPVSYSAGQQVLSHCQHPSSPLPQLLLGSGVYWPAGQWAPNPCQLPSFSLQASQGVGKIPGAAMPLPVPPWLWACLKGKGGKGKMNCSTHCDQLLIKALLGIKNELNHQKRFPFSLKVPKSVFFCRQHVLSVPTPAFLKSQF